MSEVFTLLVLSCVFLLVGNEFTVGVLVNPLFRRLPTDASQASAARESARLFGKVMPFWMGTSFLLCLALTFLGTNNSTQWWSYLVATFLIGVVIVFSALFPVPINNTIADWDPNNLTGDWREIRKLFGTYHSTRVALLLIAQGCLLFGTIAIRE